MSEALRNALAAFAGDGPLKQRAAGLFAVLGYRSELTEDVGSVAEFMAWLGTVRPLTDKQRQLFEPWRSADIVLQITEAEIADNRGLFGEGFDRGRAQSFLFVAADLEYRSYSRTELAEMTRAVNRRLPMPVILVFRHGAMLTLAAVHRRAHKRDAALDVLERVTLIKDIQVADPHRAHLDILGALALPRLITDGVRTFDDLHAAWERVLDIAALNRRFYRELFAWFECAAAQCTFPDDGSGSGSPERHVIRLITRLLFIWFLKEKGLVPERLFNEDFACSALTNHDPGRTDYYQAVLQNLFFATLNTPIEKRDFRMRTGTPHRDFSRYRYRDLLAEPDAFVAALQQVPFVNGGLFDCLDDFEGRRAGGRLIDVFTDNAVQRAELHLPARLFLDDDGGLFPLFRRYKFTVEENTPIDQEVALDPELLGRVFENLLAAYNPETRETARKTTGSYYTPRQVVDYMVHEALKEALAAAVIPDDGQVWRERIDYLLTHSSRKADAGDYFADGERRSLVAAIAALKVLDPAVGSGAFPMAILQTLTLALRRLDPNNELWETLQKERAIARAREAFDTHDDTQRKAELEGISDTFARYRQSDFGRKLYLIQNSIFGVDIQPIACQIAKLRFFISLVIEQTADAAAPNHGIRPLPNLETRFVAADTLLGLERPTQLSLTSDAVRKLDQALKVNRERHFHAGDRDTKLELRDADERLRGALAAELEKLGFGTGAAEKIAAWDPYDQNAHAGWFDAGYMFGISDGFDVVIGNPPYIQLQKDGGRMGTLYRGVGYETFQRTGDIYQIFYERGCRLLKPTVGTLAYITSNSWLKAEYGKSLRRWLAERHTALRLVEMGKDVFEEAIVDTSVLLVCEGGKSECFPAVDMDSRNDATFPPAERHWGQARPDGDAPWSILSDVEWGVLEKMRAKGTPLRDWDVRINYGIKTGYNDAFIIDSATRDAMIAEDPRSADIIKRVLRGRDIRRWRAQWAGKWLIDTHNGYGDVPAIDATAYPAVKRHLDRFCQQLERRQDKGRTPYNLRSCAYHEDFAKEKLFWMDMSPEARFAYSEQSMFCNDKGFVLSGPSLKYLCAISNSSLVTWRVKNCALTTGLGLLQWKKFTILQLPIPQLSVEDQRPFVRLVDEILAATDDPGIDVAAQEREIDRLVYGLYGLTDTERGTIEKASS